MLSYRHAFHAGNFADVLKHLVLLECLEYLKLKDKPFAYFDSHAGPGIYELSSDFSQKNREYETGITKLWDESELPDALLRYRDLILAFNESKQLSTYPGSPAIAARVLRPEDRLCLCELHTTEFEHLQSYFRSDRRAEVWKQDGFARINKQLPPRERRGLILVDPPYELKEDYQRIVEFAKSAYRTFAQGVFLFWYPVVDRTRIDHMETALRQSGIRNIDLYELGVQADSKERGMTSSGMIVINPPWTLKKQIEPALEYLVPQLKTSEQAIYRAVTLVEE